MAMTVKELRELLEDYDDDTPIAIGYSYGDHWGHIVAAEVTEIDLIELEWSAYHDMWKIPEGRPDSEKTLEAVVLQ